MLLYACAALIADAKGCTIAWWVHFLVAIGAFVWGPVLVALILRVNKLLTVIFGGRKYSRFVRFLIRTVGGSPE